MTNGRTTKTNSPAENMITNLNARPLRIVLTLIMQFWNDKRHHDGFFVVEYVM